MHTTTYTGVAAQFREAVKNIHNIFKRCETIVVRLDLRPWPTGSLHNTFGAEYFRWFEIHTHAHSPTRTHTHTHTNKHTDHLLNDSPLKSHVVKTLHAP